MEEGGEEARQECRTPAGVLPSTRPRPSALEGCEVAEDRVNVSVEDTVKDAVEADEVKVTHDLADEGGNEEAMVRSSVGGKACTEDRHGIECGVS